MWNSGILASSQESTECEGFFLPPSLLPLFFFHCEGLSYISQERLTSWQRVSGERRGTSSWRDLSKLLRTNDLKGGEEDLTGTLIICELIVFVWIAEVSGTITKKSVSLDVFLCGGSGFFETAFCLMLEKTSLLYQNTQALLFMPQN